MKNNNAGKVFTSFSDLGAALGVKAPVPRTPKEKKCKKCNSVLRHIPGTNVWYCPGTVKNEKTGKEEACGNRVISVIRSAKESLYKDSITTPIDKPLPAVQRAR